MLSSERSRKSYTKEMIEIILFVFRIYVHGHFSTVLFTTFFSLIVCISFSFLEFVSILKHKCQVSKRLPLNTIKVPCFFLALSINHLLVIPSWQLPPGLRIFLASDCLLPYPFSGLRIFCVLIPDIDCTRYFAAIADLISW